MKQLLIITGYSGAGKSVALRALEDIGFDAIDNLPLPTLEPVIESLAASAEYVAVGLDIRSHGFAIDPFIEAIRRISGRTAWDCRVVFLAADAEVLLGRFKETRRPHPLAPDRPLMDGIQLEQKMLEALRAEADDVIDTSTLIPRDLTLKIQRQYDTGVQAFAVQVLSFSYKFGLPREADLVFDVRFLQNPHYVEILRPQTGKDEAVANYIRKDKGFEEFVSGLKSLLQPLLPRYREEGKRLLTIAFGCTGGRHRSVFLTEKVGSWIAEQGYSVITRHRELG